MLNKFLESTSKKIAAIMILGFATVSFAQTRTIKITFLGNSLTTGDGIAGAYRDPVYSLLTSASIPVQFIGINCTATESTDLLNNAVPPQNCHDGFGGYHTVDLAANLDGVADPIGGGDPNMGGYWLTGGPNSVGCPDIFSDESGTNDIHQGSQTLYADKLALDQKLHRLCPNAIIVVMAIPPMVGFSAQPPYDAWIKNTLIPELVDPTTSKSYAVYVDEQSPFLSNGQIINIGSDGIHPTLLGYQNMAPNLSAAIQSAITMIPGNTPPATFALTVDCGTGSGMYPAGTIVTITTSPNNCSIPFLGWTGPVASSSSTTTTITMPAAATTVYASYGASVPPTVTQPTAPSGGSSMLTPLPLGPYQIENELDQGAGTTLDVLYGSSVEGRPVTNYWTGNGVTWTAISINGSYELTESLDGRCMTVSAGGAVTITTCTSSPSQLFVLTLNADNSYMIQ